METKAKYAKLERYTEKTLKIDLREQSLIKRATGKSYAPSHVLPSILSGLLVGCCSARELEKHHKDFRAIQGRDEKLSRETMGELLDESRVLDFLRQTSDRLLEVAGHLRVLKPATSSHRTVAIVDGIDLGQIHHGKGKCELCLERKQGDEVRYYHRLVVMTIMSKYGGLPLFLRFCRPCEIKKDLVDISEEKVKSECELTCTKALLSEIAGRYGGKLPFDVLAGDALMANAPMMELIESYGVAGIFVFKQENRHLFRQAKADFTGQTMGFDISRKSWDKDPSGRSRVFSSQWSTYIDNNRKGVNKEVKIIETTRTELDGSKATVMAIASARSFVTPELVEEVRFAKWNNLENGVFNELTNQWGTLKHLFFHKSNAIQAMTCIQFLALMIFKFYCFGNLTRGGRRFIGTVRDFFKQMIMTFFSTPRRHKLIDLRCNSP